MTTKLKTQETTVIEKTVRRGTKLFDKAIDGAKNLTEYAVENGFIGKAIDLSKTKWTPEKGIGACQARDTLNARRRQFHPSQS